MRRPAVTHVRQNRIGHPARIAELQRGNASGEVVHGCQNQAHRLGKIRNPQYRIAVADARTRRDGRSIEVIGRYHPKEDPSLIEIDSERAQYWLSVGAQPTEPVLQLLKITGDWQKFKGLPGAEGTLKVKEPQAEQAGSVHAALAAADGAPSGEATQPKKKKAPAKKADEAEAAAEPPPRLSRPAEPAEAAEATEAAARMSSVVVDAVEHLVRGIVDNPDDVRVDMVTCRRGRTVEVHVHPEDLGKVIGRGGRTATRTAHPGRRHRRPRYPRGRGRHRPVVLAGWCEAATRGGAGMELVVGRVVKAHGSPVSSSSNVRTDEPRSVSRRVIGCG